MYIICSFCQSHCLVPWTILLHWITLLSVFVSSLLRSAAPRQHIRRRIPLPCVWLVSAGLAFLSHFLHLNEALHIRRRQHRQPQSFASCSAEVKKPDSCQSDVLSPGHRGTSDVMWLPPLCSICLGDDMCSVITHPQHVHTRPRISPLYVTASTCITYTHAVAISSTYHAELAEKGTYDWYSFAELNCYKSLHHWLHSQSQGDVIVADLLQERRALTDPLDSMHRVRQKQLFV